ncbi:hypothetical protein PWT90_02107 [Aphanocladium album]|nr:hypothetical protein PWT90_02107 [Aphanocladium album]
MKSRINSTVVILTCLGTGIFLWLLMSINRDALSPYIRIPTTKVVDTTTTDHTVDNKNQQQQLLVDGGGSASAPIPNTVHYVYILANTSGDFNFAFSEVMSIYAASHHLKPDAIYLHTNAPPEALERARSGAAGKYTQLLFAVPNLEIAHVTVPTHTRTGKAILAMEHKSDFVRVAAMRDYGGVYLDFDVHPLRDLRPLRESGFAAVTGRQQGDNGEVNSGAFLTRPHARMIELWADGMHEAFDGQWSTHSNGALTIISEQLVAEDREVLIMERHAFAPGSWLQQDTIRLLEVHDEETSSLDMMDPDGHLPQYEPERMMRFARPKKPDWADDWARTYMLHAFNHNQRDVKVHGFDRITPRYILERKSNMARAVYPIARELYEQGHINVDDPYKFNVE